MFGVVVFERIFEHNQKANLIFYSDSTKWDGALNYDN